MDWTFFDKIYCINVNTNSQRYETVKKIFEKLNMNVEFLRVEPLKNGTKGCFESHIKVMKDAFSKKYKNIIVFEDDILPNKINQKRIDTIINFIKNNVYDIFYLGICPDLFMNDSKIVDRKNKIYQVRPSSAYSYIVNENTINRLKDLKFNDIPIDTYYANNFIKNYTIFPSLFYHGDMGSISRIPTFLRITSYTKSIQVYAYIFGVSFMKILIFLFAIFLLSYIFNIKFLIIIIILLLLIIFQILYKNILE
jgi:GR25 family glycosyltransferase involved in LPS biosynthesis